MCEHPCKIFAIAAWCLLAVAGAARAQTAPAEKPGEEPAAKAEDQGTEEPEGLKISIHGYLSQAYAQSDGNQFLGITKDGTADYRTAALQIRADVTQRDAFAVQFSHERFGNSPIQTQFADVDLDWIFYEHRFGEGTTVKVGKVQTPYGIYNEVRDVGTLLPFYRPSHNFYADGAFSTETIDGIVLSHRFTFGSWGLDGDLHYGNWEFLNKTNTGAYVTRRVDDSMGVQLWLQTPLSGLRIGAGAMDFQVQPTTATPTEQGWNTRFYSLDSQFGRVVLQAEYRTVDVVTGDVNGGYVHLGVGLTEKLSAHGQYDDMDLKTKVGVRVKFDMDHDEALGLKYDFTPAHVLKAEYHWNETAFWAENVVPAILGPTKKTEYWLLSFATSF
jgi:hypothetical protein